MGTFKEERRRLFGLGKSGTFLFFERKRFKTNILVSGPTGASQDFGEHRGVRGIPPESPLVCPDFLKSGTHPGPTLAQL